MTDFLSSLENAGRYLLGYPPAPAPDKDSGLTLADLVAGKKAKGPVVPKPVTTYDAQGNAHQYMPSESMSAAQDPGFFQRVGNAFTDVTQHHSPAAMLTRYLSGYLPSTSDWVGTPGADNSQAAQQARAKARVVQTERNYRDQQAGAEADNPTNTVAKKAASFIGAAGGGLVADPTSLIAPGKTLVQRMLAQSAVSGTEDAAQQGLEMAEGTRDNFDPAEAAWSAATGGVLPLAHHALKAVIPQSIKDRFAPSPAADPDEISSPSNYVDRANNEGLDFINSPKAGTYFNKNAAAIHDALSSRIADGDPAAAATQLDRRVQQADDYYGEERRAVPQAPGVDGTPIDPLAPPVTRMDPAPVPPAYDPVVAAQQRERLSTLGSPPEDPRMSTPEGEPTNLTFPKGDVRDISAYNDEGLRAKIAAAGLDPENVVPMEHPTESPAAPVGQTPVDAPEPTPVSQPAAGESTDPVVQQHMDAAATTDDDTLQNRVAHFTDEAAATGNPQDEAIRDAYTAEQERRGGGGPDDPIDHTAVAKRLTRALNQAQRLLPEQQRMYTAERRARLENVYAAKASSEGETGLHAELSALKGEMPKQDFTGVRDQFSQAEVDSLFDAVKNHPAFGNSAYAPIRARVGLAKLLDGKLPTNSELQLLGKVFDPDFIKAALKHRSNMSKFMDAAGNALNIPRAVMSSYDLSAPFRQGLFLAGRKEFWGAFKDMFKAFGSERAFHAIQTDIQSRPTYDLMQEAKLYLADPNHQINDREEQFMSSWAEKIPVVGRGIRASDRAYTGFLNKVRADTFDSIIKNAEAAGNDIKEDPKAIKDLGSFINNATGRGNLGKTLSTAGPVLNALFFSPRLIASRVTLLNPTYYATLSPVIRKEAVRSLLHLGAIATTVTGLAAEAGLDVESDPRSSDFGKIKTGQTHYDILGGFGQYVTLGARMITNQTKSNGNVSDLGGGFGKSTRLDVAGRFATSKLSPVAGFLADYLRGKTYTGAPFSVRSEAANVFTPLFLQDAQAVMQQEGVAKGAAMSVPGLFGVGMNTYSPVPAAPTSIKVNKQDVPLNDDAQAQYTKMVQSYLDENIKVLKQDGDWAKYTRDERNALTYQIVQDGRKQAKHDLFEGATPDGAAPVHPTAATAPTPAPTAPAPVEGQPLFDGFEGLPTSIRRTAAGNERVGGVAHSDHLSGDAVDFVPPKGMTMSQLEFNAQKFFGPNTRILNEGDHVHVHIPGLNGPLFGHQGAH